MTNIVDLRAKMKEAIENGDDSAFLELSKEVVKAQAELKRAEAEKAKIEAEKFSKARTELSEKIHKEIAKQFDTQLKAVGAFGFTYKVDKAVPNEADIVYKACLLLVPGTKANRSNSHNGGAGKTKDEYGMSLGELVDKFATDDELANIGNAESNSKSWQLKMSVKRRVIKEGLLTK